ncbi:V-type ATP synthase subunit F [uncultured Anaerotruncus sp.]|uniref:V-type ATP synthase subunit F n=1 Tax=uncultured Anaerotruncus sp. TaxID=905011 RepID=UPI00280B8B8A|nr:V-type ATP synthase subunit F [uncultured Anaerotruncus sp.]
MYRTAVMGDRDSIYGFAALGLDTFPVTDPAEAAKQLRRLAEGDYAVIYVTEALAAQLETEIDRYRAQRLPAIIPIPGVSGNTGMGIRNVKKSVEQAVGSDIIFGGN